MRIVIIFDIFLNPSFKTTASFVNVARNTAVTTKFIKSRIHYIFHIFLDKKHPNIKFTTEKQFICSIAFLDVFISGIDNINLTILNYNKMAYPALLSLKF